MLSGPFQNYEEFKELFGWQEHGNGTKSRKNKILLAFHKSAKLREWIRLHEDTKLYQITNMQMLKVACLARMTGLSKNRENSYAMNIHNRIWWSSLYTSDFMHGKTEDGDRNAIRYIKVDVDRVYKMRAGKMYAHLVSETEFAKYLPIQVTTWLVEELTSEWCGWNTASDEYTLHVDDNFYAIYNSDCYKGDFSSCMTDRGFHTFYRDAVNCKAAYLTNEDEDIVARAIIFCECYDENNNKYRLLERQYSTECDDVLKQILVNKLIAEGEIDGYKKVGAGCHDSRMFVSVTGEDLSTKKFRIDCELEDGDTLSYQDSFKYYNEDEQSAYNYDTCSYDTMLDETSGEYESSNHRYREWDEYHSCYCEEVRTVYYHGNAITCDSGNLDDFIYVESAYEYHHEDDVIICDQCGWAVLKDDAIYSELTNEWYCDEDCCDVAEDKYYKLHPEEDPCHETV